MKEEQIDFPNSFQQKLSKSSTLNSSMYPEKLNSSESIPFSLDDITGDVHHIQTSLDNIRELMFDNLPDGTTIEDLFCDDHVLLSPLLTTNSQTTNILTDNTQQSKVNNQFIYPNSNGIDNSTAQCKQIILHKSEIPIKNSPVDVDNQLLEQLINETAKVEEQRQTINQLEREKINLEGKIHRLEQQQTNQRK
jgi:hypothetical protein